MEGERLIRTIRNSIRLVRLASLLANGEAQTRQREARRLRGGVLKPDEDDEGWLAAE